MSNPETPPTGAEAPEEISPQEEIITRLWEMVKERDQQILELKTEKLGLEMKLHMLSKMVGVEVVEVPVVQPQFVGCLHEYPNPWHGITPPPCKKCGLVANSYQVTCHGGQSG